MAVNAFAYCGEKRRAEQRATAAIIPTTFCRTV